MTGCTRFVLDAEVAGMVHMARPVIMSAILALGASGLALTDIPASSASVNLAPATASRIGRARAANT